GRERTCWTEIGTPVSKRAIADSIVETILRQGGIPLDLATARSPRLLDFGPPAFEVTATDIVAPAGAVSLPVQRTLVTDAAGYLGKHWRLNWENRIERKGSGYLISEGARQIEFAAVGNEIIGPSGERIVAESANTLVRVRPDLTRDGYDAQGRLAWRDFGNGNRAALQYDARGRLARIDGPRGTFLAFSFDPAGHLIRIASSTGEAVTYEYSGSDLVGVETPFEPMVRYAYQGGRLARIEHPAVGPLTLRY